MYVNLCAFKGSKALPQACSYAQRYFLNFLLAAAVLSCFKRSGNHIVWNKRMTESQCNNCLSDITDAQRTVKASFTGITGNGTDHVSVRVWHCYLNQAVLRATLTKADQKESKRQSSNEE